MSLVTSTPKEVILNVDFGESYTLDQLDNLARENNDLAERVNNAVRSFDSLSVGTAMQDLSTAGELLALAKMQAGFFECSVTILDLTFKYQSFMTDAKIICARLPKQCFRALDNLSSALGAVDDKDLVSSFKWIGKTRAMASEMAKQTKILADRANELRNGAGDALHQAEKDKNTSEAQRKAIEEARQEFEAQQKQYEASLVTLKQSIEACEAEQKRLEDESKDLASKRFTLRLTEILVKPIEEVAKAYIASANPAGAVVGAIAGNSNAEPQGSTGATPPASNSSKAEDLQRRINDKIAELEKESDADKKKKIQGEIDDLQKQKSALSSTPTVPPSATNEADIEVQLIKYRQSVSEALNQERQQKANLDGLVAKAVTRITDLKVSENDIKRAIASLILAEATLGKISTIFQNACAFWAAVDDRARELTEFKYNSEQEVRPSEMNRFLNSTINMAINWWALAKISLIAHGKITDGSNTVNTLMSNLPKNDNEKMELVAYLSNKYANVK